MPTIKTVRTLDDLRYENPFVNPSPNEITTVVVQGYVVPGDGGGGTFVFHSFGSNPALEPVEDGGIFIGSYVGSVQSAGIWVRQFTGYIDMRFYNLQDGYTTSVSVVTSNTNKLQSAINFAAKCGQDITNRPFGHVGTNTVFIPNGSYMISQLIMKTGVRLVGASMTHTQINSYYDNSEYLITNEGLLQDIQIENIRFYGNLRDVGTDFSQIKYKGCFGFIARPEGTPIKGGIWESTFKNVFIYEFLGNSILFQGGLEYDDYSMPNQFITMEGVQVESVGQLKRIFPNFNNEYHALAIVGLGGQFSFNNCRFDGANNLDPLDYQINGLAVYIGSSQNLPANSNPILLPSPAIINFNTCTMQNALIGLAIESVHCVTVNTCWFENLERAISVTGRFFTSKAINIHNNSFGGSASSQFPGTLDNQGRVLSVSNGHVNIHNNYIINPLTKEYTLYVAVDAEVINGVQVRRNLGINSSGNYFEPSSQIYHDRPQNPTYPNPEDIDYLGYTNGIMKEVDVTNLPQGVHDPKVIYIEGSRTIFVTNLSSTKTIDTIKSLSVASEYLFLRSNGGTIRLTENGNLFLGAREVLLQNGDIAFFIKVDNEVIRTWDYGQGPVDIKFYETYNLVSVRPYT